MPDIWLPDLARTSGAKYLAIAEALASAIESGSLKHGDRILPQREVAARLGVDLTTVTKAFDTVRERGLIEARGRAGSFALQPGKPPVDPAQLDTGMNMPPELPGDLLGRTIAETSAALLATAGASLLHYQPAGGAPQDRAAGARYLSALGLPASEDQVIVTAGGQNALHAILSAILAPGDAVACGSFVYPGVKALAERLGLNLLALPRMDAAALSTLCREHAVRALYVVPTNDNPTTATLPADERKALAAAAERHDLQIIEDDAYGGLAAQPIAPVAAFAPNRTWHVASLSKLISPALRVAYVRAPSIAGALRLAGDVHETAVMAPPLNAALVTHWLAGRNFTRLIEAMRREANGRRTLALELLAGLQVHSQPEGYHLWLELPAGVIANDLAQAMRPTGMSVIAGDRFAVGQPAEQAVRVSLGGLIDRGRLSRALRMLHGHIASPGRRTAPIV